MLPLTRASQLGYQLLTSQMSQVKGPNVLAATFPANAGDAQPLFSGRQAAVWVGASGRVGATWL